MPEAAPSQPARVLGPIDATCVVVGCIIGVGIFFGPASTAALTGSGGLNLLAWGIGGVIALCGALAFAELGGMYNASGAQYEILRDAYGPMPAFLYVFCNNTVISGATVAIIAITCAQNLSVVAGEPPLTGRPMVAVASLLIVALSGANLVGVRWGSRIQNLTVYAKVLALLAITLLAATMGKADPLAPAPAAEGSVRLTPVAGVMAALVTAMFAYGGWQQVLWMAGEVKNPRRTLPRAIWWGVVLVVAIYLLVNWAYLRLLGVEAMGQSKALAADAVATVFPGVATRLTAAAVAVSAFGVLNAQFLSAPRLIYGMARDGRFFSVFGRLSRRAIPDAAIYMMTGLSLVLLIAGGQDGVNLLLTGEMFIDTSFFALTGAALIVLRRRRPAAERPVRTPGYPILPIVFVVGELGALAGTYVDPEYRNAAWIGAACIGVAAVVYFIWFRSSLMPAPPGQCTVCRQPLVGPPVVADAEGCGLVRCPECGSVNAPISGGG
jgi:APA family basic amino acid/polyamine antiporter